MSRQIMIDHNNTTYYAEVMTVESTSLGSEDHGILTAYLHMKGGGTGIGVGGYGLDTPVSVDGKFSHREPTAYGFDHVMQLMRTVGVSRWEDLPGKSCLILFAKPGMWGQTAKGIAHLTDEKKVLVLSEHSDEWAAREPVEAPGFVNCVCPDDCDCDGRFACDEQSGTTTARCKRPVGHDGAHRSGGHRWAARKAVS